MSERDKQLEAPERGVDSGEPAEELQEMTAPPVAAPPSPPPPQHSPPQHAVHHPQQFMQGPAGRRYGFLCTYCSSRLEATESVAGQTGTCPTCGKSIVIPILDARGRLIDPTSGEIIKQDPHPVHAYAAAGHKAPLIVTVQETGAQFIKCPRCARQNSLASNNCMTCGLPFTMEGTAGDAISGTNTWAVASLVLGIVSSAGGCAFMVPPVLAVVFGLLAMRGTNQSTGQTSGQGMAIAGIIMGTIGVLVGGYFWVSWIRSI